MPHALRSVAAGLLVVATAALSACSTATDEPTTAGRTPSAIPTGQAETLLLGADQVPPAGTWSVSDELADDTYAVVVCGVSIARSTAVEGADSAQFSNADGVTLYESVEPMGANKASTIVTSISNALPDCTTYEADGVTYEVDAVSLEQPDVVAWADRAAGADVWTVHAYAVVSHSLVGVVTETADADSIEAAASQIDATFETIRGQAA